MHTDQVPIKGRNIRPSTRAPIDDLEHALVSLQLAPAKHINLEVEAQEEEPVEDTGNNILMKVAVTGEDSVPISIRAVRADLQ